MRRILFLFLATVGLSLSANSAWAQTSVTPTQYQVQLQKVELCGDAACTSSFTLGERNASFNLAASAVGAAAGAYAQNVVLTRGNRFTHLRVMMSRNIVLSGNTTATLANAGGAGVAAFCYTNAADTTSTTTAAGLGGILLQNSNLIGS